MFLIFVTNSNIYKIVKSILIMPLLPAGLGGGLGGVSGIGSALAGLKYLLGGLAALIVFGLIIGIFIYRKSQNKKYNIPLVIITPRSDGLVAEVNEGMGGFFKSKRVGGIASFRIKRKGIGTVEIPPPPSSYLCSPNRTLFLAQKGVDDYEPINPRLLTWVDTEVEIEENGVRKIIIVKQPVLNLKAINQQATAWNEDNEETAKKRFTLFSLWEKYQVLITLMVFVFILFLVMYINWMGMKDVVAGLKDVAESLHSTSSPIITPGG